MKNIIICALAARKRIITMVLALVVSAGMLVNASVKIGDLYYNLDATNQTAELTHEDGYGSYCTYSMDTIIVPPTVLYEKVTYTVTAIAADAFSHNSPLRYIVIPNTVTSIGSRAFYYCAGLTSVTIPEGVTSIGESAFYHCTSLTSVTIPNSVTSIGDQVFYRCTGLTSISIPDGVTSIGKQAFYYCTGLTSVTIPKSVTSIGNQAFYYCTGLASVVVTDGNTKYDSRNKCNAIIETASNMLIVGCKNTIIPNSVTSIGDQAFCYCMGLPLLLFRRVLQVSESLHSLTAML